MSGFNYKSVETVKVLFCYCVVNKITDCCLELGVLEMAAKCLSKVCSLSTIKVMSDVT